MDRTDIEKAAIRAVGNCIDGPMLSSHISENDRTPIWDGDIFVYTGKEKDNEHFLGRVPVQVKGKKVTEFSEKKISYQLTRNNLENFKKDGGCIFFVAEVMMNSETQKTQSREFYCVLNVAFIADLLDKDENVQNPTFHLLPVPTKKVFTEKVIAFTNARYKNLVEREMEEIEGLENRINRLLDIISCISKDEYKSLFTTYIAELEALKQERKSIWIKIKKYYSDLNKKMDDIADESIRNEIETHSKFLLSNLYNCQSKWIDKFMAWIPEIIKNNTKKDSHEMADDDLYDLIFNYANYLLSQNKFHLIKEKNKKGDYFDKALRIARKASSPDSQWRIAEARFSKAELLRKLNRYNEAINEYNEALELFLGILKKNPEVDKLDAALNCIRNLAFLYDKLNHPIKVIETLYIALRKSLRALSNDAPSYYNWSLFRTLVDFGSFYKEQNQLDEKWNVFKEADEVYNKLLQNQITVGADESIATVYETFGIFHQELYHIKEAEDNYNEAQMIYKKMAKANRDAYMDKVAMIHRRLANLYSKSDSKKTVDAENQYKEALNIYEELAETNPGAYMWNVALILIDLANLHMNQKLYDKAEPEYNKALEIFKEILESFEKKDKKTEEEDRIIYMGDVADLHYNLGRLHSKSGDYLKAETELNYAFESHKILATFNPQKYNAKVAGDLLELQKVFGNRLTDAQQAVDSFNDFLEKVSKQSSEIWKDYLFSS